MSDAPNLGGFLGDFGDRGFGSTVTGPANRFSWISKLGLDFCALGVAVLSIHPGPAGFPATDFERRSIDIARIRTIKPEAFASESLAAVSLSAERTFFGLLTQADDHGRFRDQAAVIAGLLWSLRPEHGPMDVEDDLNQLHTAGLLCRYEGEDSKRYLHIVTFAQHQKINRPSGSRCPACPHHQGGRPAQRAGSHHGRLTEPSVSPPGVLTEDSRPAREPSVADDEPAAQGRFSEASRRTPGGLTEDSVNPPCPDLGPRILDLGSPPVGGASAPAPQTATASVSAKDLVGDYIAACEHRPPSDVLGRLGRQVNKLLAEGIAPDHIRAGMDRMRTKGLSVSLLPSLVNEAMNTPPPDHGRCWRPPAVDEPRRRRSRVRR